VPDADHLILGGGPAGSRAAQTIRKRDPRSRIVLVTEEPHPFPNRILLSKEFLTDDGLPAERAVVVPAAAFERLRIVLLVDRRVARLDPEARTVDIADGERFAWDRCLWPLGRARSRFRCRASAFRGSTSCGRWRTRSRSARRRARPSAPS
jgi:NADPH-dependent 2,4-dienoyl-CoA reductase/sulfur reductase-like enzyme